MGSFGNMAGDPRERNFLPYHGCVLERKECSQVLDDVDSLEESLPDHLKPYLRTFRAVMVSICGIAPGPSWEDDIAVFKAEFLAVQQLFGLKEDQDPKLSSLEKIVQFKYKLYLGCICISKAYLCICDVAG